MGVVLYNILVYNSIQITTPCFHCTPLWWILTCLCLHLHLHRPQPRHHGRFPKFHRVFFGRDPGTLKSDIVSKRHPQLIRSDLRLSNWKFEDWNYGNRPQCLRLLSFLARPRRRFSAFQPFPNVQPGSPVGKSIAIPRLNYITNNVTYDNASVHVI